MPRAKPNETASLPLPHLAVALNDFTNDTLRQRALVLVSKPPTRKSELVDTLVAALTDLANLKALYARMSSGEQQVVAEVLYNLGGRYKRSVIEAKYGTAWATARPKSSYMARASSATPYELVYGFTTELGSFIPPDVQQLLREFVTPPPKIAFTGSESPPPLPAELYPHGEPELFESKSEEVVFHDLAATLALIRQGKISVSTSTSMPTLAALRNLRERLLHSDYFASEYGRAEDAIRPTALILLAQATKWAAVGMTAKLELTRIGEKVLSGGVTAPHIRDAWNRWLNSDLLDELTRVKEVKGLQSKGTRLTKPASRRTTLSAALAEYPPNRWILFNDLLRHMRAADQLPQIERTEYTNLYLGYSREYGWLGYDSIPYWDVVQGSYLRVLLWEYAATLGLVEVAYTDADLTPHEFGVVDSLDGEPISRYDGLWAFKLTDLGAFVFGVSESYTPPMLAQAAATPLIRILPNLDLVVLDQAQLVPLDRNMLERIGIAQSQGVYQLNRDTILDSAQHGLNLDQVREFLLQKSMLTLEAFPQTVRVFLDDLATRMDKLREGGRMVLIEGDDAYLLTELANNAALRGIVQLATIGKRKVLLVPEQQEQAVRKHLKKLGYVLKGM